ncbi:MAG: YkgJ family cysteine cluster protein [Polyangiaceae bacterium]
MTNSLADALRRDETLAALLAAGLPEAPLLALAAEAQCAALDALQRGDEEGALGRTIAIAERALDELAAARRRSLTVLPDLACRKGCSSCCQLRVEITELEARRLVGPIRALHLELTIEQRAREVGSLSKNERLKRHVSCALLGEDGACRVHEVRPLACRAANSFDRVACERAFAAADVTAPLPVDSPRIGIQRACAVGLRTAQALLGLPNDLLELHVAVTRALVVDSGATNSPE